MLALYKGQVDTSKAANAEYVRIRTRTYQQILVFRASTKG